MSHQADFPGLQRYQASQSELVAIRSTFVVVAPNVDLRPNASSHLRKLKAADAPGLYFWVMNFDGGSYKIYLGRTNALSRRLYEYTGSFQPHSPNDYKLQVFHAFLLERVPSATLDLLFSQATTGSLQPAEKAAIQTYRPLLNEPAPMTIETRRDLQDAFSRYYRGAIERRLLR